MFITLIVGILNLKTGQLTLCNSGHNQPALISPDGKVSLIDLQRNLFAGIMEDFEYADEEIRLEKGSKLFLYTDGITEAENAAKELYGEERMIDILSTNANKDIRSIVNTIINSVAQHVQTASASDDLTVLIIHFDSEINKQK